MNRSKTWVFVLAGPGLLAAGVALFVACAVWDLGSIMVVSGPMMVSGVANLVAWLRPAKEPRTARAMAAIRDENLAALREREAADQRRIAPLLRDQGYRGP